MAGGHLGAAIGTASGQAERLDRDTAEHTPDSLSVYGLLVLRGAIPVNQYDKRDKRGTAHELLGEAVEAGSDSA